MSALTSTMASAASSIDAESTIADDNLQTPDAREETEDVSMYCSRATWHMAPELRQIRERDEAGGEKLEMLGVALQNLTVTGIGGDATFNENVVSQFSLFHRSNTKSKTKTIIDNSFGCVKPGEMLLVLGQPGAGCTSLLNVLSNNRLGYKGVTEDVSFGSMSVKEAKQYRGQIVMNTMEEILFPTLTVEDTIDFAARMKVPYYVPPGITTHEEYVQSYKDFLMRSVGISHTATTKVGDAFISAERGNVSPFWNASRLVRARRQGGGCLPGRSPGLN
ncbi:hypothetical protein BJX65DRAFT_314422 [Aspergillus insuetus]